MWEADLDLRDPVQARRNLVLAAVFGAASAALLVAMHRSLPRGLDVVVPCVLAVLPALAVVTVCYGGLCALVNRGRIEVDGHQVTIRVGPLPVGKRLRVPVRAIRAVRAEPVPDDRRAGGIGWTIRVVTDGRDHVADAIVLDQADARRLAWRLERLVLGAEEDPSWTSSAG